MTEISCKWNGGETILIKTLQIAFSILKVVAYKQILT